MLNSEHYIGIGRMVGVYRQKQTNIILIVQNFVSMAKLIQCLKFTQSVCSVMIGAQWPTFIIQSPLRDVFLEQG